MGTKLMCLAALCVAGLVSMGGLAATSADVRPADNALLDAARGQDWDSVRSLLKQHAPVNTSQPDGTTALSWASYWDNLEAADALLHAEAKVDAANDYGVTPLGLACGNASNAMVGKLLDAGANPNAVRRTGETVLMTCASTGATEGVKLLLAHKADPNVAESRLGQTALMLAAAKKHPEVTRLLIEHGADVHARTKTGFTPLLFAAQQGDLESAKLLLAAGADVNEATKENRNAFAINVNQQQRAIEVHEGENNAKIQINPLLMAAASGQEDIAIFLVEKGADPSVSTPIGMTPLHYAVLRGFSIMTGVQPGTGYFFQLRPNMRRLIKALLAHGANPNPRLLDHLSINDRNIGGATPYLLAASCADAETMRLLVAGGADPKARTEMNTTALMWAAGVDQQEWSDQGQGEGPSLEAVKVAFELGGDINASNADGRTALHGAADTGLNGVIQFLVEHGANINAKDKFNQTPLSLSLSVTLEGLTARKIYIRSRVVRQSSADLLLKLGAKPLSDPMYAGLLPPAPGAFPMSALK